MPGKLSNNKATTNEKAKTIPIKAVINWLNPDENNHHRATASLIIGGAFTVHGIKVINGSKGEFIAMPSYKGNDGYKDIFHAVTAEARRQINESVINAYELKLSELNQEDNLSDVRAGHEKGQLQNNT